MPCRRWVLAWCGVFWYLLGQPTGAPPAAEYVYFTTGKVLPIVGHAVDGRGLRFHLRDGGEVLVDPRLVVRIETDTSPVSPLALRARSSRPRLPAKPYADLVARASARHGVDARLAHALIEVKSGYGANAHSAKGAMGSRPRLLAKPYADLVASASARHGVDARLVHALIEVESGYRANAHSAKGAMGLMQLMPATAARYAVGNPFDPSANIDAGTRHLKTLLEEFGTRGALAAYNAGESTVRRFRGIPPYPETRRFVSRVLKIVADAVGR